MWIFSTRIPHSANWATARVSAWLRITWAGLRWAERGFRRPRPSSLIPHAASPFCRSLLLFSPDARAPLRRGESMLRLRNRLFALFRAASPLPAPIQPRPCCLLSTSTTVVPFSLVDYLVAACGLAPAQTREVSKKAFRELSGASKRPVEEISRSRLLSASNPDAIIALLAGAGLSRADIAAAVFADPTLLRASAKNIAPRLLALHDRAGLSTPKSLASSWSAHMLSAASTSFPSFSSPPPSTARLSRSWWS